MGLLVWLVIDLYGNFVECVVQTIHRKCINKSVGWHVSLNGCGLKCLTEKNFSLTFQKIKMFDTRSKKFS